MKKVINTKLYDTSGSPAVASSTHGKGENAIHETLHRKRTGEFFLHGEGGPASRYAKPVGDGQWANGEELFPMSVEAAQNWVKSNVPSQYDDIFGEKQQTRQYAFTLPVKLVESAKKKAAAENLRIDTYLVNLLSASETAAQN